MLRRREKKNKKEFEKIYDTHVEQIYRFVYLKVDSKETAEDITSKVFTRTWKSLEGDGENSHSLKDEDARPFLEEDKERFGPMPGEEKQSPSLRNPRAFLYKTARNLVIDYYRKNRPQREEEDTFKNHLKGKKVPLENVVIPDKEMRADERAIIQSQVQEVKTALREIKEEYQNIIIWYYLDELTTSEIADLLGKPESSVRVLIHRAVAALRKELK